MKEEKNQKNCLFKNKERKITTIGCHSKLGFQIPGIHNSNCTVAMDISINNSPLLRWTSRMREFSGLWAFGVKLTKHKHKDCNTDEGMMKFENLCSWVWKSGLDLQTWSDDFWLEQTFISFWERKTIIIFTLSSFINKETEWADFESWNQSVFTCMKHCMNQEKRWIRFDSAGIGSLICEA